LVITPVTARQIVQEMLATDRAQPQVTKALHRFDAGINMKPGFAKPAQQVADFAAVLEGHVDQYQVLFRRFRLGQVAGDRRRQNGWPK
jgi:hypothetical protein